MEKIGIFIDILRLYFILIILQNYNPVQIANKILKGWIFFIITIAALLIFNVIINSMNFMGTKIVNYFMYFEGLSE